jgi:hypothetical protein
MLDDALLEEMQFIRAESKWPRHTARAEGRARLRACWSFLAPRLLATRGLVERRSTRPVPPACHGSTFRLDDNVLDWRGAIRCPPRHWEVETRELC